MTEKELVTRCVERDEDAWNEFFRRYEGTVRRAVLYKLNRMNARGLKSDVDDIIQEVFLDLWRGNKLKNLRDVSKLKSWLVVVAINKTSSYRKRRAKDWRVTRSLHECMTEDGFTLEDVIPTDTEDPSRAFEIEEIHEGVRNRINQLKPKESIALSMNILGEERLVDIAGIMDMPVNTVTAMVHRGKRKIEKSIREYCLS